MVESTIFKIVAEQFNVDEDSLNKETSFKDTLNADSLDLVELVMALEDEFDLDVEDENVEEIKTIGDAIEYINNILEE